MNNSTMDEAAMKLLKQHKQTLHESISDQTSNQPTHHPHQPLVQTNY